MGDQNASIASSQMHIHVCLSPHFCIVVLAKWIQLPVWYCSLQAFSMCFIQSGFKYLTVAMSKAGFLPLSGKDMSVAYSTQGQDCKELPFSMWVASSYLSLSPRCFKKAKRRRKQRIESSMHKYLWVWFSILTKYTGWIVLCQRYRRHLQL